MQSLENTLIVPRVLGDAVKVHPLVILAGVLVGAATAGVLGVFLAAPVIASLREILGYLYRKVLNVEPFPVPSPAEVERGPTSIGRRSWRARLPKFLRAEVEDRPGVPPVEVDMAPARPKPRPGARPASREDQEGQGRRQVDGDQRVMVLRQPGQVPTLD